MKEQLKRHACKAGVTTGVSVFIAGRVSDGFELSDLAAVGVLLVLIGATRMCIKPAIQPQVESYQAGHEAGYDLGFYDGHRAARPVVVPLRNPQPLLESQH